MASEYGPEEGMTILLSGGYSGYIDGDLRGHLCASCMDAFALWLQAGGEGASLSTTWLGGEEDRWPGGWHDRRLPEEEV